MKKIAKIMMVMVAVFSFAAVSFARERWQDEDENPRNGRYSSSETYEDNRNSRSDERWQYNDIERVRIVLLEKYFRSEGFGNRPEKVICQVILPLENVIVRKRHHERRQRHARDEYASPEDDDVGETYNTQRVVDDFFHVFTDNGWKIVHPRRHIDYSPECIVEVSINEVQEMSASVACGPDPNEVYHKDGIGNEHYFELVHKKLLVELSNNGIEPVR